MVPEPHTLAVFALAAIALAAVPGPAVLYIVAQSVGGGRAAGLFSALGVATGGAVHVAAAAIGLSSLLVSSALAFEIVKYAGAAYLVFLGLRRLLAREERDRVESYALGVNSYIVKPLDFEQFVEAMRLVGMYWLLLNQPPKG